MFKKTFYTFLSKKFDLLIFIVILTLNYYSFFSLKFKKLKEFFL